MENNTPHMIVGISGASGAAYGVRALELLQTMGIYTHLIMSKAAHITLKLEMNMTPEEVGKLANQVHPVGDIAACISSGSFKTMGMLIAPCSMRSVGEIASGVTSSLLTRAADVVLKERRTLVLMVRETPLHSGHLENMLKLSHMGAIIAPPVPAFYTNPTSIDDLVDHSVGRALDLFNLDTGTVKRWKTNAN
jgi:4-hydroxy-3-polyprenylbenzoate decarboxylase